MIVRPPAAIVAAALAVELVSLMALPTYGADGARVATKAVSWLIVAYSVWTSFAQAYLAFLGLSFLPVVTAALLFAAVVVATLTYRSHHGDGRGHSADATWPVRSHPEVR